MELPRIVFAPIRSQVVEVACDVGSALLIQGVHPTDDARKLASPLAQPGRSDDQPHQDADQEELVHVDTEHLNPSAPRVDSTAH